MAHWQMRGAGLAAIPAARRAARSGAVSAVLAVTAGAGPGVVPRRPRGFRYRAAPGLVRWPGAPAVRHLPGEEERVMRTTWV